MPELMDYLSLPEKDFPGASKFFEVPIINEDYFNIFMIILGPPIYGTI